VAKSGPKPKPAALKLLAGNPGGRPIPPEIKPDPIAPDAPPWMSKRGKAVWAYLSKELKKNALLTRRDRESFAFLCEDAAIAQEALLAMRGKGNSYDLVENDAGHQNRVRRHPAFIVYAQAVAAYRRAAAEFGLTPSSRVGLGEPGGGSIGVGDDDEDDESLFR
jgi:P27 family predicted phage terminase small subunit